MTKPKPKGEPKTHYTIETLHIFCSKNKINLIKNYKNDKITRDTKITGKCLSLNCNNDFNKCQGYEPFALDKLVKEENISEEDIVTGCKNVPEIWYNDEQDKKTSTLCGYLYTKSKSLY